MAKTLANQRQGRHQPLRAPLENITSSAQLMLGDLIPDTGRCDGWPLSRPENRGHDWIATAAAPPVFFNEGPELCRLAESSFVLIPRKTSGPPPRRSAARAARKSRDRAKARIRDTSSTATSSRTSSNTAKEAVDRDRVAEGPILIEAKLSAAAGHAQPTTPPSYVPARAAGMGKARSITFTKNAHRRKKFSTQGPKKKSKIKSTRCSKKTASSPKTLLPPRNSPTKGLLHPADDCSQDSTQV